MRHLDYVPNGDYFIPALEAPEPLEHPIGKYGRMRQDYLQNFHPITFSSLVLNDKLYHHLSEIEQAANRRLEGMMTMLAQDAGATEQLKASDPMKWVGLMNACKAQAEEVILHELIYCEDEV